MQEAAVDYISLFSGAGGLDLGLESVGWKTTYACDFDAAAIATLKANAGRHIGNGRIAFESTHIEQIDISRLDARELIEKSGLKKGSVPLLAGGPPCQSWSSAGRQLGFDDPRGRLFEDFIRLANGIDARWLLLENVRGLLTARGRDSIPGSALQEIRLRLLKAGFQTTVALLNAADYGVAQRRVRLFLLGFRQGDPPPFPLPTHAREPTGQGYAAWLSLSGALCGLADLKADEIIRPSDKLARELANLDPGTGLKSAGKTERTRPGGHWGYKQGAFVADVQQPARTVTASTAQDWIKDPVLGLRRLSPRECAAIQSFPASWDFKGSLAEKYRLIGNAVPPKLAAAIGGQLLQNHRASVATARADFEKLLPLDPRLAYHVNYTAREEASNGASRRAAQPVGRNSPVEALAR